MRKRIDIRGHGRQRSLASSGVRTCSGRNPTPITLAGNRLRKGRLQHQAQGQGELELGPAADHAVDDSVLDQDLEELGRLRGELAPFLDLIEVVRGHALLAEGDGEDVGGGDGVLDGEVDAHAADRRHRVRGVADAEQAETVPGLEPVDLDGQELDVVPAFQLVDTVAHEGRDLGDVLAERLDSLAMHLVDPALFDDEAALPVVAPLDHDEDLAALEAAEGLVGVRRLPGEPHPEHVNRGADVFHREFRAIVDRRMTAIRPDGEPCPDLQQSHGGLRMHADDRAILFDEVIDLGQHQEAEGWEFFGVL